MASPFSENHRVRKDFSKITSPVEIPNLIELQRKSYEKFLQADVLPQKRDSSGLQAVFKSVFPIEDFNRTAVCRSAGQTIPTRTLTGLDLPTDSASPMFSHGPKIRVAGGQLALTSW